MLLQLVLLILFAEQLNQRNFVTRRSLLILPLVCLPLLFFLEPNFRVPSTPFCKSPVHFLKADVVIVLLLSMAVDKCNSIFGKFYLGIWRFGHFSYWWEVYVQYVPDVFLCNNYLSQETGYMFGTISGGLQYSKTGIVFISIHSCCFILYSM